MSKTFIVFWVFYFIWIPCVLFKVPFNPFGYIWTILCIGFLLVVNYWPNKPKYDIPIEGRRIKITWLSSCRNVPKGTPNPYIGMEGIVKDVKPNGNFILECDTCWLVGIDKYKFEYTDEQEK